MSFDFNTKMIFTEIKKRVVLVCINRKQLHWKRKQNL